MSGMEYPVCLCLLENGFGVSVQIRDHDILGYDEKVAVSALETLRRCIYGASSLRR